MMTGPGHRWLIVTCSAGGILIVFIFVNEVRTVRSRNESTSSLAYSFIEE